MSAPASSGLGLSNVRLITILAASLLAGYAGDEAYNAWWPSAKELAAELRSADSRTAPDLEAAKLAVAPPANRGR